MKKLILILFFISFCSTVYALRIARPLVLSYPITQEQVSQLNRYLEDVWNMQSGRYEMDTVTSTKTNSRNGEMWMIKTGPTIRIQYKSGDHIFTITPDGVQ